MRTRYSECRTSPGRASRREVGIRDERNFEWWLSSRCARWLHLLCAWRCAQHFACMCSGSPDCGLVRKVCYYTPSTEKEQRPKLVPHAVQPAGGRPRCCLRPGPGLLAETLHHLPAGGKCLHCFAFSRLYPLCWDLPSCRPLPSLGYAVS